MDYESLLRKLESGEPIKEIDPSFLDGFIIEAYYALFSPHECKYEDYIPSQKEVDYLISQQKLAVKVIRERHKYESIHGKQNNWWTLIDNDSYNVYINGETKSMKLSDMECDVIFDGKNLRMRFNPGDGAIVNGKYMGYILGSNRRS